MGSSWVPGALRALQRLCAGSARNAPSFHVFLFVFEPFIFVRFSLIFQAFF